MQKVQSGIFYTIMVSEIGHVFCCVIPTVISLIALGASYGVIIHLPHFLMAFHEIMHQWEPVVISVSGVFLAIGWALYALGSSIAKREQGACCSPLSVMSVKGGRSKTAIVMVVVTLLFAVNVTVYLTLHRNAPLLQNHEETHHTAAHGGAVLGG